MSPHVKSTPKLNNKISWGWTEFCWNTSWNMSSKAPSWHLSGWKLKPEHGTWISRGKFLRNLWKIWPNFEFKLIFILLFSNTFIFHSHSLGQPSLINDKKYYDDFPELGKVNLYWSWNEYFISHYKIIMSIYKSRSLYTLSYLLWKRYHS